MLGYVTNPLFSFIDQQNIYKHFCRYFLVYLIIIYLVSSIDIMQEVRINKKYTHLYVYFIYGIYISLFFVFFFVFLDSALEFYGMKRNRIGHRLLFCIIIEYIIYFYCKKRFT